MTVPDFKRARSAAAKQLRESAILEAARELGAERGIRQITLTDIAEAVGMHKSALLRYFETREEIFLRLTAEGWREWSAALRAELDGLAAPTPAATPRAVASAMLVAASSMVQGRRAMTSYSTGWPVRTEVPRSKCERRTRNWAYWTGAG